MNFKQFFTLSFFFISLYSLSYADDTELGVIMDEVNGILKKIARDESLDNPARAQLAKEAAELYINSLKHKPADIEFLFKTDLERAIAIADYKAMIGLSYAHLCSLEIAYLKNDEAAIEQALSDIKASKKKGHKKYIDE